MCAAGMRPIAQRPMAAWQPAALPGRLHVAAHTRRRGGSRQWLQLCGEAACGPANGGARGDGGAGARCWRKATRRWRKATTATTAGWRRYVARAEGADPGSADGWTMSNRGNSMVASSAPEGRWRWRLRPAARRCLRRQPSSEDGSGCAGSSATKNGGSAQLRRPVRR
jgi:hypothetical protein